LADRSDVPWGLKKFVVNFALSATAASECSNRVTTDGRPDAEFPTDKHADAKVPRGN
jgi:hypothetical protein